VDNFPRFSQLDASPVIWQQIVCVDNGQAVCVGRHVMQDIDGIRSVLFTLDVICFEFGC